MDEAQPERRGARLGRLWSLARYAGGAERCGVPGDGRQVRLVHLNVLHGGHARRARLADAIAGHRADVAVLTEYRAESGLGALMTGLGFVHREVATAPRNCNAVAVFSRTPIQALPTVPEVPATPPGKWIEAHLPEHSISLVAILLPGTSSKTGAEGKRAFWRAVRAAAVKYGQTDALIVGDLNTGAHRVDEVGATLVCADDFVALESAHGWRDAWRLMGSGRREFTWYSPRKGGGKNNGFRLDHMFVTPSAARRVRSCEYSHDERLSGASDHAAQVLDLE